jgi:hypothetical protein
MIRLFAIAVLCLGVSTLGFARPCSCDDETIEETAAQMAGDHSDCPHAALADQNDATPEGEHDCGHCAACVLTTALPLPVAGAFGEAPIHADFALIVVPPCQGNSSLPLRPPIT